MTDTILAVLADRHGVRACLEAAFAAGQALDGASVAALHVRIDPRSTILPTEEMLTDVRRHEIEAVEAAERRDIRAAFDAAVAGLSAGGFRWIDAIGTEAASVTAHAAGAALVVTAVPPRHYAGDAQEALHAALFDTGRPLLLVPRGTRHHAVRRITVGWHDDEACRRAVADARPWLARAELISVVAVDGGRPEVLDGARMLLAEMSLKADFVSLDDDGSTQGAQLIAAATGADWLVMGAYRRGRFLDWLFGSVTEVVMSDVALPVFFAH